MTSIRAFHGPTLVARDSGQPEFPSVPITFFAFLLFFSSLLVYFRLSRHIRWCLIPCPSAYSLTCFCCTYSPACRFSDPQVGLPRSSLRGKLLSQCCGHIPAVLSVGSPREI